MTDWTYFANADASAYVTLEPGVFRGESMRNNGPAVRFDDGAGGVAVVAADRAALIEAFEAILERIKSQPEPAPDAKCKHCGRAIRYPNAYDGPEWLHRPFLLENLTSDDWTAECLNEDGAPMLTPGGDYIEAEPATDPDAVAKPGDQVLDLYMIREDGPELDRVVVVSDVVPAAVLDNNRVRPLDELEVIERYEGGQAS